MLSGKHLIKTGWKPIPLDGKAGQENQGSKKSRGQGG